MGTPEFPAIMRGGRAPFYVGMTVVSIVIVVIVFAFIARSYGVEVGETGMTISGLYGLEVEYSDIEDLRLLDSFPTVGLKLNGINALVVNIGIFSYSGFGRVRLFELDRSKPYLLVETKKEKIIIGMGGDRNRELYARMAGKIAK